MANKKFQTKLNRLETIVTAMEQDDLELEKAMKYFEEGVSLVKSCEKDLDQAEAKVTMLLDDDEIEMPLGSSLEGEAAENG